MSEIIKPIATRPKQQLSPEQMKELLKYPGSEEEEKEEKENDPPRPETPSIQTSEVGPLSSNKSAATETVLYHNKPINHPIQKAYLESERKKLEQKLKLKKGGKKTNKKIKRRKWSAKYKRSINCKRPKGFSQKQYCKYGRKKTKKHKKKGRKTRGRSRRS